MGGEDGSTTGEATALMMLAAAADGLQPTASFEERRPLNPMEGFRRRVSAAGAPPPPVSAMLQQLSLLVSSLGAGLGAVLEGLEARAPRERQMQLLSGLASTSRKRREDAAEEADQQAAAPAAEQPPPQPQQPKQPKAAVEAGTLELGAGTDDGTESGSFSTGGDVMSSSGMGIGAGGSGVGGSSGSDGGSDGGSSDGGSDGDSDSNSDGGSSHAASGEPTRPMGGPVCAEERRACHTRRAERERLSIVLWVSLLGTACFVLTLLVHAARVTSGDLRSSDLRSRPWAVSGGGYATVATTPGGERLERTPFGTTAKEELRGLRARELDEAEHAVLELDED